MGMIINPYSVGLPAGADPSFASVVALLHFDGSNGDDTFDDQIAGSGVWLGYSYTPELDTAHKEFGSASVKFDAGDNITRAHTTAMNMGSGNFTIEGWFRPITTTYDYGIFYVKGENTTGGIALGVSPTSVFMRVNGTTDIFHSIAISSSAFTHVAFTRSGSSRRIWVNGVQVASATGSFNQNDTSAVLFGCATSNADYGYAGHIDEFRVTKGVARYSSTFTPTGPFPDF